MSEASDSRLRRRWEPIGPWFGVKMDTDGGFSIPLGRRRWIEVVRPHSGVFVSLLDGSRRSVSDEDERGLTDVLVGWVHGYKAALFVFKKGRGRWSGILISTDGIPIRVAKGCRTFRELKNEFLKLGAALD